jgi:hypothetical protein
LAAAFSFFIRNWSVARSAICGDLALLNGFEPFVVGLDQHDLGIDVGARKCASQLLLGGRAGQHADFLAGQELDVARTVGADHEARAVDEDRQGEIDDLSSTTGWRSLPRPPGRPSTRDGLETVG